MTQRLRATPWTLAGSLLTAAAVLGHSPRAGAQDPSGPGRLLAELLFRYSPLDHRVTGDTHLGSATLFVGYRALL